MSSELKSLRAFLCTIKCIMYIHLRTMIINNNNDTITNIRSILPFDYNIEWLRSLLFVWSSNLNYYYVPLSSFHHHFLCHCQWSLWKSNERLQIYICFSSLLWCQQQLNLEHQKSTPAHCTRYAMHRGFEEFYLAIDEQSAPKCIFALLFIFLNES